MAVVAVALALAMLVGLASGFWLGYRWGKAPPAATGDRACHKNCDTDRDMPPTTTGDKDDCDKEVVRRRAICVGQEAATVAFYNTHCKDLLAELEKERDKEKKDKDKGNDEDEDEGKHRDSSSPQLVWVTKFGRVYHISKDCKHVNNSAKAVDIATTQLPSCKDCLSHHSRRRGRN